MTGARGDELGEGVGALKFAELSEQPSVALWWLDVEAVTACGGGAGVTQLLVLFLFKLIKFEIF